MMNWKKVTINRENKRARVKKSGSTSSVAHKATPNKEMNESDSPIIPLKMVEVANGE